eukprot:scaffold1601_cov24-Attheya_sp.AAC.1
MVGCDGSEALWQALSAKGSISPRASDFDLITAIRTKIAKSPIKFIPRWIKGHQDSSMPGGRHQRLDNWARLTQCLNGHNGETTHVPQTPSTATPEIHDI